MSAITAKASRKMKKYAVLTREPRCFLGSFDLSWEQRKFSDITFPAGEKNRDNLPLESYSITNEHGFVPQDEKFENGGTMREADKRMYYIVSPNSFAYNPARINVGSIGYQNIGKNVIVSSLYEVFKTSEDVDDRLLWHWFKSPDFQKLIMQLQEGGVRLYFYYDKLCMGEVSLPSLEEQRKIGKLFDTLDNLITLHQRKCIFFTGRAGRLISTVNKKRITSSWEQRKFEEIAVRSSVICSDDTLPRVEYEDIVSGTGRLNKDIYAKQSSKSGIVFHQGDVLYGKLRPYLQNWLLPTFDGLAVGDFWVLQPQNADSSFLYRLIQSRQFDEVANQSTGTKMPRADWKLVSKTVFSIPSNISEQAAIGTYFTALDSLITLHQRKPFLMKWRTSDANRNQTNRLVL